MANPKKKLGKLTRLLYRYYNFKPKVSPLQFSLTTSSFFTLTVWTTWWFVVGPNRVPSLLKTNWEVALTMVFGSIVAGGTSMGGGAVAFPVLTKILQFSQHDAKIFSLAIQSVGMIAASLNIIAMKTKVEWKFIFWASLGGIPGIFFSSSFLALILPSEIIKISFTMLVSSFAVVLFCLNRTKKRRNLAISSWGKRKRIISLITGLFGGIISGLVGSGMDILSFAVMVLAFGLCEKISIPTSVILMAINAVVGFVLHKFMINDFTDSVINCWLAAVPVVVIGAPVGSMLCSFLKRETTVSILIGIILIELISSLFLIPLNAVLISFSVFIFVLFCSIYYWMYLKFQ